MKGMKGMKGKTLFQLHLDKVRAQLKNNDISHEQACRVVSCDFGIDPLALACKWFLLDFDALSEVYRAIEKILYKLGLFLRPRIKRGLYFYVK